MTKANKQDKHGIVSMLARLALLGPVGHGQEGKKYGEFLVQEGFEQLPGVWVKNPGFPVVLTAHLDTVRYTPAQSVRVAKGRMYGIGGGLGADDKVGVTLVVSLARKLKNVTFALFEGEEVGGIGASEAEQAKLFEGTQIMASLDRRGTTDVIYEQGGYQTASVEFAGKLASALSGNGIVLSPSNNGIFTDSEVFAHRIPECVNISVGYQGAHTSQDTVDLVYMQRLYVNLLRLNWDEVPNWVRRTPKEKYYSKYGKEWWKDYTSYYDTQYDTYYDVYRNTENEADMLAENPWALYEVWENRATDVLIEVIYRNPSAAARVLRHMTDAEKAVLRKSL